MSDDDLSHFKKLWDFNWGVMDVLIGGRSSIDLSELRFKNWAESTEFLQYYGFDPDNAGDARKIHSVIIESWNFIETYLMPKEWQKGLRPPDEMLDISDVRDFIIAASDRRPEHALKQAWACAILRIMHTIAHIDGVQRFADVVLAGEQIMQRFRKFIFRDQEGVLNFGRSDMFIPLFKLEWKLHKSRESMILKLLHKKANVAETIYDLIGVRMVTRELQDVPVVVKFLRDFHVVTFANCNPSRSKNSLIDMEAYKHNVETLKVLLDREKISKEEFSMMLKGVTRASDSSISQNPHSGSNYRSIQLTCRQLIRVPSEASEWQDKLKDFLHHNKTSADAQGFLQELCHIADIKQGQGRRYLGFYPFEIQILDAETYKENQSGSANHQRYKQSQIRAARRRVLGTVLTYRSK